MDYVIYDKQLEQIKASGYESRQEAISSFAEHWRHIARDDELRDLEETGKLTNQEPTEEQEKILAQWRAEAFANDLEYMESYDFEVREENND